MHYEHLLAKLNLPLGATPDEAGAAKGCTTS